MFEPGSMKSFDSHTNGTGELRIKILNTLLSYKILIMTNYMYMYVHTVYVYKYM